MKNHTISDWVNDVAGWFVYTDTDSLERGLLWLEFAFSISLYLLADSVFPAPPPWWRLIIPILPPMWWSVIYTSLTGCMIVSRMYGNYCWKLHVSLLLLGFTGFLCGPLYFKTPGLCIVMMFLVVPQAALSAQLRKICDDKDREAANNAERLARAHPGPDRRSAPR